MCCFGAKPAEGESEWEVKFGASSWPGCWPEVWAAIAQHMPSVEASMSVSAGKFANDSSVSLFAGEKELTRAGSFKR